MLGYLHCVQRAPIHGVEEDPDRWKKEEWWKLNEGDTQKPNFSFVFCVLCDEMGCCVLCAAVNRCPSAPACLRALLVPAQLLARSAQTSPSAAPAPPKTNKGQAKFQRQLGQNCPSALELDEAFVLFAIKAGLILVLFQFYWELWGTFKFCPQLVWFNFALKSNYLRILLEWFFLKVIAAAEPGSKR